MKRRKITAVDLYCGAGGSSTGLYRAAAKLGLDVDLLAINHWQFAIATHSKNHPFARHLQTSVNSVDPRIVVPGGHLDVLWASPECIHFSVARGGKPVNLQSRASAWHVLHWLEAIRIDTLVLENVKEFRTWGPLKRVLQFNKKTGKNQRVWVPDKKRAGETYQAFLAALRSLNYRVEEKVLNAADYGDPTTRERLYLIAKRGERKVRWPEPSHTKSDNGRLFGERQKWRAAREVIDWNIPGRSIFNRKKPLADATMRRIIAGLERFGGKDLEPFLVVLRNHGSAQSLDSPVPTLCAGGTQVGIAQPFQVILRGKSKTRSIDEPTPVSGTKGAHIGVVQPFLIGQLSGNAPRSTENPLMTITTTARGIGLAQPFITKVTHTKAESHPVRSTEDPLSTITTAKGGEHALVQPFLLQLTHGARVYDANEPIPTITGAHRGETAIVNPVIAKYYGTGQCRPVTEPLDTISTKDRFALVMPIVNGYALDIRFRMLQPKELAAAMGFPPEYTFEGSKEVVVKQIGNAVAVNTAAALCEAVLS